MNIEFMTMQNLVVILQGTLIVAIAVLVARLKERPPIFWGVMSLFFGIYALFVLVLLPKVQKEKEESKTKVADDVSEAIVSKTPPAHPEAINPPSDEMPKFSKEQIIQADWFYINENKSVMGPVTVKVMQELVAAKKVTKDSWVWCEFLPSWRKVGSELLVSEIFYENK